MWVFESAPVKVGAKSMVVIRVPDLVLANPIKAGAVMERAEIEFKRDIVLLGADTAEIVGSLHLRRYFRSFDPQKAKWSQWNMEE